MESNNIPQHKAAEKSAPLLASIPSIAPSPASIPVQEPSQASTAPLTTQTASTPDKPPKLYTCLRMTATQTAGTPDKPPKLYTRLRMTSPTVPRVIDEPSKRGYTPRLFDYNGLTVTDRLTAFIFNHPTFVYLGSIFTLTFLITILFVHLVHSTVRVSWVFFPMVIMFALLCKQIIEMVVKMGFGKALNNRILPGLNFEKGILKEHRAMIIWPVFTPNEAKVKELKEHIIRTYQSHRGCKNLLYGIVSDSKDSGKDPNIMILEKKMIGELNDIYSEDAGYMPFYGFHRKPVFYVPTNNMCGWEKKRGCITQWNKWQLGLIKGEGYREFGRNKVFDDIEGDISNLGKLEYFLTLDLDGEYRDQTARKLIEKAAHSNNVPVIDLKAGKVVQGYGIINPVMQILNPQDTVFTSLLDRERRRTSWDMRAQMNLFGEGTFYGKGLVNARVYELLLGGCWPKPDDDVWQKDVFKNLFQGLLTDERYMTYDSGRVELLLQMQKSEQINFRGATRRWVSKCYKVDGEYYEYDTNSDRFPENRLLSHDILEGGILRTAFALDLEGLEEAPTHFIGDLQRTRRWGQGDKQIFCFALPRVPDSNRKLVKSSYSIMDRWKLLNNLYGKILDPILLIFFVTGVTCRIIPGLMELSRPRGAFVLWLGTMFSIIALPKLSDISMKDLLKLFIFSPKSWEKIGLAFADIVATTLIFPNNVIYMGISIYKYCFKTPKEMFAATRSLIKSSGDQGSRILKLLSVPFQEPNLIWRQMAETGELNLKMLWKHMAPSTLFGWVVILPAVIYLYPDFGLSLLWIAPMVLSFTLGGFVIWLTAKKVAEFKRACKRSAFALFAIVISGVTAFHFLPEKVKDYAFPPRAYYKLIVQEYFAAKRQIAVDTPAELSKMQMRKRNR